MSALARGQSSNCSNPVLDLFTHSGGVLVDIYALEFQIFDATTATPTQVYPATAGTRQTVNVGITCPTANAGRESLGHYFATWTVPGGENLGAHFIRWFYRLTSTSSEVTFDEEFEVLAAGAASVDAYCFLHEMRAEGVTTTQADDAFLLKRIATASRFIEAATKRYFTSKKTTLKLDGRGGAKLLLQDPIIAVSAVEFDTTPWAPSTTPIDIDLIRIYNRHISQGLTAPDDRNNPKLELFHPSEMLTHYGAARSWSRLAFPEGQQNISVSGVFGYTDAVTPNTQGKTPDLITHVCKLIVMRELDKIGRTAARFDRHNRHRITSERTRDQAYTLEPLGSRAGAFFTGDPEIDNILATFMRPPALGAA